MKGTLRRVFRVFTIVLFLVSAWTAYSNVYAPLPDGVGDAARKAACGGECRITHVTIDRGMLGTSFTYDVVKTDTMTNGGRVAAVCRRAQVIVGDYRCTPSTPSG